MSEDIQVGDTIELTYTGKVTHLTGMGGFELDGHRYFGKDKTTVVTVIVPAPRTPKVGDILEGEAAFDSLPKGALVRDPDHGFILADGKGGFVLPGGGHWSKGGTFDPRELVYLPD